MVMEESYVHQEPSLSTAQFRRSTLCVMAVKLSLRRLRADNRLHQRGSDLTD